MTDLEARWFDEGTASDVATAFNARQARVRHRSPHWVKTQWAKAQERGALPPVHRPENGFDRETARSLMALYQAAGRVAA